MILETGQIVTETGYSRIIATSWSLGLELQAYLFLPFIFAFPKRIRCIIFLSGITITFVASQLGFYTDYLCYRLLPGTLYIFLTGALIYKRFNLNVKSNEGFLIEFVFLISIFILLTSINHTLGYHVTEVCIGLIIGIPLIVYASQYKTNQIFGNKILGIFHMDCL